MLRSLPNLLCSLIKKVDDENYYFNENIIHDCLKLKLITKGICRLIGSADKAVRLSAILTVFFDDLENVLLRAAIDDSVDNYFVHSETVFMVNKKWEIEAQFSLNC